MTNIRLVNKLRTLNIAGSNSKNTVVANLEKRLPCLHQLTVMGEQIPGGVYKKFLFSFNGDLSFGPEDYDPKVKSHATDKGFAFTLHEDVFDLLEDGIIARKFQYVCMVNYERQEFNKVYIENNSTFKNALPRLLEQYLK